MLNRIGTAAFLAFAFLVFGPPADLSAQGRGRTDRVRVRTPDGGERVIWVHKEQRPRERRDRDWWDEWDDDRWKERRDRDRDRDDLRRPRRGRDDDRGIVLRDGRGRIIVLGDDDIRRRLRGRNGHGPPFCRSGAGHPVHGRAWCLEKGWGLGFRDRVFFDGRDIVFWDDDRSEAFFVRNRAYRNDLTLWEAFLRGTLELVD